MRLFRAKFSAVAAVKAPVKTANVRTKTLTRFSALISKTLARASAKLAARKNVSLNFTILDF